MRSLTALSLLVALSACSLVACGDSGTTATETDTGTPTDTATDTGSPADAADTGTPDSTTDGGDDGGVVDCTGKADGTACGTGNICLKGVCAPSRCGDGFVDPATEECEDGNELSGDGCSACKFECKLDTDCNDGNDCTTDSCDKSTAGKQLCKTAAVTGTPTCKLADGTSGTCSGATCKKAGCGNSAVDTGEECDDGNTDDTDGCKKDCTFTCKADADCSDGNACNGTETCDTATHKCKAGTPAVCGKGKSCLVDGVCDPATGACTYLDGDKDGVTCDLDCNDADPGIFPASGGKPAAPECKDGKDNDCNGAKEDNVDCVCYADGDGDGYAAASAATITAVTCPTGYTKLKPVDAATTDCRDNNASVFPGQKSYFPTSYCNAASPLLCVGPAAPRSFDYNCNGAEETQYKGTAAASCVGATNLLACVIRSGWVTTVPACGVTGTYRSCSWSGTSCTGSDAKRVQPCH